MPMRIPVPSSRRNRKAKITKTATNAAITSPGSEPESEDCLPAAFIPLPAKSRSRRFVGRHSPRLHQARALIHQPTALNKTHHHRAQHVRNLRLHLRERLQPRGQVLGGRRVRTNHTLSHSAL